MPTMTRDQVAEMKSMIKECMLEVLSNDEFLSRLTDKMSIQLNAKFSELENQVKSQQETIGRLETKLTELQGKSDNLDQYSKRNNIRIHGFKIMNGKDLKESVVNLLNTKLGVAIELNDVSQCYEIGNGSKHIFVSIKYPEHREKILRNRKNLKGSKIGISEDLTKNRMLLYKSAQEKYGKYNCWILNGKVYAKIDGKKHHVITMENVVVTSNKRGY